MKTVLNRYYFVFLGLLGVSVIALSFVLGREEGKSRVRSPVVLSCPDSVLSKLTIPAAILAQREVKAVPETPTVLSASIVPKGKFVGSKNGTKYYTPGCSGAKRIKPENYRWFSDEESAKLQGYTAGKC